MQEMQHCEQSHLECGHVLLMLRELEECRRRFVGALLLVVVRALERLAELSVSGGDGGTRRRRLLRVRTQVRERLGRTGRLHALGHSSDLLRLELEHRLRVVQAIQKRECDRVLIVRVRRGRAERVQLRRRALNSGERTLDVRAQRVVLLRELVETGDRQLVMR